MYRTKYIPYLYVSDGYAVFPDLETKSAVRVPVGEMTALMPFSGLYPKPYGIFHTAYESSRGQFALWDGLGFSLSEVRFFNPKLNADAACTRKETDCLDASSERTKALVLAVEGLRSGRDIGEEVRLACGPHYGVGIDGGILENPGRNAAVIARFLTEAEAKVYANMEKGQLKALARTLSLLG
ncbi:hypothetical protein V9W64_10690 [Neisseria leonii]|uniref:Uncharacterized protein n=1 Tax=Neisseria leonii TaxID=2995413 RepID=A0A9X4IEI0_9NEIS|nr:hypothetical protein [Neisseria sp. 51.81]MDD9328796.1 hypothetical protein [Neisseria sp. 51.81]